MRSDYAGNSGKSHVPAPNPAGALPARLTLWRLVFFAQPDSADSAQAGPEKGNPAKKVWQMTPHSVCANLTNSPQQKYGESAMKYVLSRSSRFACPSCGSSRLSRSHERSIYDYVLRSIFHIKPYRCLSCDDRHYRYRPSSTQGGNAVPSAPK